jgi:putative Mg2+ transporter-C (MgtC) family protein
MEVEATLFTGKEEDGAVEALVAQLSLRSSIISTSWVKLEESDWPHQH